MSEPVAIVDWHPESDDDWLAVRDGRRWRGETARHAMRLAEFGHPLRWECAGPHTFHGYPIEPEAAG